METCLLGMCVLTRMRTEEVKRRVGVREKLSDQVDQKVLKWLQHVKACVERSARVRGGGLKGWSQRRAVRVHWRLKMRR